MKNFKIILILTITSFLFCNFTGYSQQHKSGTISSTVYWSVNSPRDYPDIIIDGNLTIAWNGVLNIDQDLIIWVRPSCSITVNGLLSAPGTKYHRITFTEDPNYGTWSGIIVTGPYSSAQLNYCIIEHVYSAPAIQFVDVPSNSGSYLTLNLIQDNDNTSGNWAAGIHCDNSIVNISTNTVCNNIASGSGGGISCINGDDDIMNNIIHDNTAYEGAGIYCYNSLSLIKYNNIYNNNATMYGGGIYCDNQSYDYLTHEIISNRIINNSCTDVNSSQGGGIYYIASAVYLHFINNLIVKCSAWEGGGINIQEPDIYYLSVFYVNNCTIADNTCIEYDGGAGIYSNEGCGLFGNDIFWNNLANSNNNSVTYGLTSNGTFTLFQYCDLPEYSGSDPYMIITDPQFDDAANNDYRVSCYNSDCIDAGNDDIYPALEAYDIRGPGHDRIIRILRLQVDIGAYEQNSTYDPILNPGDLSEIFGQSENNFEITFKCYPNPLVLKTNIELNLNSSTKVRIEIFNSIGNSVDLLVDKRLEAGNQNFIWNVGKNPKGVYLCKVTINNNKNMIRKLIVE